MVLKVVAIVCLVTVTAAALLTVKRGFDGANNTPNTGPLDQALPSALALATPVLNPPTATPIVSSSIDKLHVYLRDAGKQFPVSVVDRVQFFTPMVIDARTLFNQVQIDFTAASLKMIKESTLAEFLVRAVEMTQIFNCAMHKEVLDRNVAILNRMITREPDANNKPLPVILVQGKKIQLAEGFLTTKQICESVPSREDFKPAAFANAEDRLLNFIAKHQPAGTGTGWPISNGLIVTNNHVANGRHRLYVVRNDRQFREARVLVSDPIRDISVLKVDDSEFLPPAFNLAGRNHDIGERVFTIGYPWTSTVANALPQPQLSQGIISSLPDNGIHYQLSMPVHGGNSGGPLLTMDGKVTGIVVSKMLSGPKREGVVEDLPQNVSNAIKISHLQALLNDLSTTERVAPMQLPSEIDDIGDIAPQIRESVLLILIM